MRSHKGSATPYELRQAGHLANRRRLRESQGQRNALRVATSLDINFGTTIDASGHKGSATPYELRPHQP